MFLKRSYVFFTLILATLVSITISMACSYWFFSSFMGEGYAAIGAGIAGCAIQLFGYGFSASFVRINAFMRFVLCVIPLSLSMVCSYSALYGYLDSFKDASAGTSRHQDLIVDLLKQSQADRQIVNGAAQQSLKYGYRNQAKDIIARNDQARDKDEKLLEKLEAAEARASRVTPLDGLIKITGGANWVTAVFCLWLAVLFDMLPVIAIAVVSRGIKHPSVPVEPSVPAHPAPIQITPAVLTAMETVIQTAAESTPPNVDPVLEAVVDPGQDFQIELVIEPDVVVVPTQDVAHPEESDTDDARPADNEIELLMKSGAVLNQQTVISAIISGEIQPSYRAVREYSGWSRWVTEQFFKKCVADRIVERNGKAFEVVSNVVALKRAAV